MSDTSREACVLHCVALTLALPTAETETAARRKLMQHGKRCCEAALAPQSSVRSSTRILCEYE